jgi:hypothetical protein
MHSTSLPFRLISLAFFLYLLPVQMYGLPYPALSFIQDEIPDTIVAVDTLEEPIRVLFIPDMGSLQDPRLQSVSYLDHLRMEYTSPVDNLKIYPGIYVRDKGSVGQPHEVIAYGAGWRSIGAMIDGRPANDPMTGVYDFNLFATEYISGIEYLPPSRSFLYQRNAVGSAYNFITQSYVAPSPYTKLRYSEGPNNYSQTDVVLSQDIVAGVNLMAGLQRQFFGSADPPRFPGRFPNMNYRNLHYRTKLRWNLQKLLNVAAAYSYTNTTTGLSGGIDLFTTPPDDIFNTLEATVRTLRAFQRVKRHDLTVSASAQILPDSLDTSNLTAFYSNHLREYREQDRATPTDTLAYRNDYRTLLSGIDFKQWLTVGPIRFHTGGTILDIHVTESDKTGKHHVQEFGGFVRSVFEPLPQITANMMLRGDWLRGGNYVSYGADLTLTPLSFISVTGGGVHAYRHPTIQELYWQDSTVTRTALPVSEAHDMLFAEVTLQPLSSLRLIVGGMYRYITDPIIYEQGEISRTFPDIVIRQGDSAETFTGYAKVRYVLGKFSLEGMINAYRITEEGIRRAYLPEIDIISSVKYRSEHFNGALDLQVKLEALYISDQFGVDFDPETYFSMRQGYARIGPSGLLNGSVVGKVGRAYLHITYRNITGTEYMRTPFYPMYESYLRFGITWEFLN